MAENRINEKCLCIVYDGTGYGDDGHSWGGEFFIADYHSYERVGHVGYMPMPGGDQAIHHPGRMAIGALFAEYGPKAANEFDWMAQEEKAAILAMLEANTNCPLTSGMGRLFDAAAALLGMAQQSSYEGQPAILLEGIVDKAERGAYPLYIDKEGPVQIIDGGRILMAMIEDMHKKIDAPIIAARFHNTIVSHTVSLAKRLSEEHGVTKVCLSGGCFQNAILLKRTTVQLASTGLVPVVHRLVPPNDGSISYGQVAAYHASR
jgi:hydrogenase maturation protein HypF